METSAFKSEFAEVIHKALGGPSLRQMLASVRTSLAGSAAVFTPVEQQVRATLQKPDAAVAANNRGVLRLGLTVAAGLVAILAAIAVTTPGLPIMMMVRHNVVIFAFVAVIELTFFTQVISKYVPAPPSTIMTAALSALQSAT